MYFLPMLGFRMPERRGPRLPAEYYRNAYGPEAQAARRERQAAELAAIRERNLRWRAQADARIAARKAEAQRLAKREEKLFKEGKGPLPFTYFESYSAIHPDYKRDMSRLKVHPVRGWYFDRTLRPGDEAELNKTREGAPFGDPRQWGYAY